MHSLLTENQLIDCRQILKGEVLCTRPSWAEQVGSRASLLWMALCSVSSLLCKRLVVSLIEMGMVWVRRGQPEDPVLELWRHFRYHSMDKEEKDNDKTEQG